MKIFLLAIFLFYCSNVFPTEARYCIGSKDERLDGLKELGNFSVSFKKKYGYIPNPEVGYDEKYEKGIPKKLHNYLISTSSNPSSVQYACALNISNSLENSDLEICTLALSTGEISCQSLGFEPEKQS